jgi:O-antigen/teichoic acid export membrane protein
VFGLLNKKGALLDNLKHQVMDGLKWSVIAKLLTQIFSWVSTFLVIRMLSPSDYGVIAIAMVFFSLISVFTTNGLSSALVRQQKREHALSNQIFTLSIFVNIVLSVAVAFSAQQIADAYGNQDLVSVLYILAIINPLTSLMVVPAAHLQMEMKFKKKAFVETLSGIVGAVTAFVFAYMGEAYWALIYSNIVMIIVKVVGTNYCAKSHYYPTMDFSGAKEHVAFALNIQIGSIVWFAYNKADTMIIGKMLGLERLGFYSVASEVASIPMSKVSAILNDVAFAAFSKSKSDLVAMKHYLEKAIRVMGVFAFPIFMGISAVSDELVYIALGDKWMDAALVISILCFVLPLRMINAVFMNFANALGESGFNLRNGIFTAIVLIASIATGAQYGLPGVAYGWVGGYFFTFIILCIRYKLKFDLSMELLLSYFPSMIISLLMWCIVFIFSAQYSQLIGFELDVYVLFITKIMIGILVAGPLLFKFYWNEIRGLLKQ